MPRPSPSLNVAACHACTLVAETSCESGNYLLDRVLVVGSDKVPGFFQDVLDAAVEAAGEGIRGISRDCQPSRISSKSKTSSTTSTWTATISSQTRLAWASRLWRSTEHRVLTFDDREPALLMYNNVLQQYTAQAADTLEVAGFVRTFHSWIWRFWREHFKQQPPTLEGDSYAHDSAELTSQFFAAPPDLGTLADSTSTSTSTSGSSRGWLPNSGMTPPSSS